MAETGKIYNTLEFGNVNSGDYGVYITGTGVYNAPARAVEMVSVPGRNGDVPIDMGHWDNIEVTYKCGLFGIDQSEMGEALMEFRNAIASQIGYQRLSDSYNPNEFRLGLFMAGLEFDAVSMNRAGEFELKFNCKPQRFLTDGEEMIDVENDWSDLKTASGEVVTFEVADDAAANYTQFKSLVADIDPIQDLHGYDKPWVGGAGKNLFDVSCLNGQSNNGVYFTAQNDGRVKASGTAVIQGWTYINRSFTLPYNGIDAGDQILLYGSAQLYVRFYDDAYAQVGSAATRQPSNIATTTVPSTATKMEIYVYTGYTYPSAGQTVNETLEFYISKDLTFTSWTPYSNTCPISGWDSVEAYVSPTQSKEDGTTHTATFEETVYGGTVDLVSGVLNKKPYYASYNGETLVGEWISDRDEYVAGTNPTIGAQVVNIGADGTDIQLTPQTITTLVGANSVWANSGDVSVEYGVRPGVLINPTQYESQPLIQTEGNGGININDYVISIDDSAIGDIDINATISNSLPSDTERYSSTLYSQATLDLSLLNDNDDLNWKGGNYRSPFNSRVFWSRGDTPPAGVSATSGTYITPYVVAYVPSGDFSRKEYFVGINVSEVPFKKGQYETITDNATITARYIVKGVTYTTVYTISAEFRYYYVAYSGSHQIQLTLTISNSSQDYTGRYSDLGYYYFISNPSFNGVSSKPIFSGGVIIDSETGDAYRIEDGTYISLNKYIQLGAQLPTLRPGANIITYDDTITSLNIAPRWWRL